ncbi:hypothetical protein, partial [Streptomyces bohaiensis]
MPAKAPGPADEVTGAVPVTAVAEAAASDGGPGPGPARPAAWVASGPIQRAVPEGRGVADAGFSGRLATFQDPSLTGTRSHRVLERSSARFALGGATPSSRPVPGLEPPSRT